MAFDSKKTILLEKTYLYVRASLGFQLEGTSTEKIPTNNGFYRFFVDNLQKSIGNSYVNILYDSQDLTLQCFCSDLYMDELMSSDSSAIEDVVEELKKNTTTILEFESGVSSAFESNHQDNVALNAKLEEFESGVSAAFASNHEDNVTSYTLLNSLVKFLSSSLTPSSFYTGKIAFLPFNSFVGGANYGFNRDYDYYFIDVDKFLVMDGGCLYTDFVNVKGCTSLSTRFDSLFNCQFNANISLLGTNTVELVFNRDAYLQIDDPSGTTTDFFTLFRVRPLFFRISFNLLHSKFSYFLFSSHSKKYSLNCCFADSSLSRIHLVAPDYLKCCCINQNLDFLCLSDSLDFRFDCDLDINTLLSLTYNFTTDMGVKSFKGSDIGLHYSTSSSNTVVCAPFPAGFENRRICKISVSKS